MNPLEVVPPQPKEDESLGEYAERLQWARERLPKDLLHAPVTGHVATAKGFRKWNRAARVGTPTGGKLNPAHRQTFTQDIFGELPEKKKTTAIEKQERMLNLLLEDAQRTYQQTGRVQFSRSVLRRLSELTGLREDAIERMTVDALRGVYAQYATWTLQKAERN